MSNQSSQSVAKSRTLRELVISRGHQMHNLWQCYSFKHKVDAHLPSDIGLCHLVLLECDPNVATYRFRHFPMPSIELGEELPGENLAEIEYKNGSREWQEASRAERAGLYADEADRRGVSYRQLTEEEIRSRLTRIWNGMLMLATIAAGRDFSTLPYRNEIIAAVLGGPAPIADLRFVVDGNEGLALAGLFELVIAGDVELDLDSKPLTDLHLCRYRRR